MNKIIEKIKSQMPKNYSGYTFRKSQELFIPYLEIGIECLIRDVTDINLFFETILKLIQIEVKNVYEISKILGISFEVAKEAIVDMVEGGYVGVSENTLRTTKKGRKALETKQLIEIKKKNINKVMIDLITGEIYDGNNIKGYRISKKDICLDKQIDVSKEFLDSNYSLINRVFQKQQENDSIFGRDSITKELYKIVDIYYENLVYIKNELLIYENDNSADIQFQMKNDVNNQYLNCLCSQLKDGTHPCLEFFFERDFNFVKEHSNDSTRFKQKLLDATDKLCYDLRYNENLDKISTEVFTKKRYMITDKEYITYFTFSDELIFEKLIIITNRVNSVLSTTVFEEIKRISSKKPVILIYNNKEFNATRTVNYYINDCKNRVTIESEKIKETKIFFAPFLEIDIEEKIINVFGKAITYKSGILDFNIDYEKGNLRHAVTIHNIDELIHKKISKTQLGRKLNKKKE